jgi:hypothetical protein
LTLTVGTEAIQFASVVHYLSVLLVSELGMRQYIAKVATRGVAGQGGSGVQTPSLCQDDPWDSANPMSILVVSSYICCSTCLKQYLALCLIIFKLRRKVQLCHLHQFSIVSHKGTIG